MSQAIRKLLAERLITREQFERAALLQSRHGKTIGYHLVNLGALEDGELVRFFVEKFSFDHWPRSRLRNLDAKVVLRIPREMAADLRVLPLELNGSVLTLGLTDPTRTHAAEEVAFQTGCEIAPVVISEIDMTWALDNYFLIAPSSAENGKDHVKAGLAESRISAEEEISAPSKKEQSNEQPAVRMRRAKKTGPSDIADFLFDSASPQSDFEIDRLSEGQLIAAIRKASSRKSIIDLSLKYLLLFSERAAFFAVKKNKIVGFEVVGVQAGAAIRSYWVLFSSESTMRKTAIERKIHLGPLGHTAADDALATALGGRPRRVLIIPVQISDRVVGLLYSDQFKADMPPWNRLERFASVVGDNLKRLLLGKDKEQ